MASCLTHTRSKRPECWADYLCLHWLLIICWSLLPPPSLSLSLYKKITVPRSLYCTLFCIFLFLITVPHTQGNDCTELEGPFPSHPRPWTIFTSLSPCHTTFISFRIKYYVIKKCLQYGLHSFTDMTEHLTTKTKKTGNLQRTATVRRGAKYTDSINMSYRLCVIMVTEMRCLPCFRITTWFGNRLCFRRFGDSAVSFCRVSYQQCIPPVVR